MLPPFNAAFTGARPQSITVALRNTHGIQARAIAVRGAATVAAGAPPASAGRHARQNSVSATIDVTPPTMSTSSGPTKLLQRNCVTAKLPPQTSTAGQTPRSPRQPLIVTTIHAGTMSETNGS